MMQKFDNIKYYFDLRILIFLLVGPIHGLSNRIYFPPLYISMYLEFNFCTELSNFILWNENYLYLSNQKLK